MLSESGCKPNKIWVDKGSQFYSKSINNIEMDSTHNEGKSVVAERFIRTLKLKFTSTWLQYQKCVYW